MTGRRSLAVFIFAIAAAVVVWLLWPQARPASKPVPSSAPAGGSASPSTKVGPAASPPEAGVDGESPIADALNAPGGDIRADLRILNEVFETWQTNFLRAGNPVGENVEITAALTGDNPHRFAFIRRGHRAINARGELCDRWGTPFRFHQVSGTQMEIRSAGPDRTFRTADDAIWPTPAPAATEP